MSRKKMTSKKKKIVLLVGTAALVGGTAFAMAGTGNASQGNNRSSQFCLGAEKFLSDSNAFIVAQERNNFPDKRAKIERQQELVRQTIANMERQGC